MDETKKYAAVSVPPREVRPESEAASNIRTGPGNKPPFTDSGFAEIEFDTNMNRGTAGEAALRFYSSVTQPLKIEQRKNDPIRQKFFDMRSLASDRPFARNDSELFYRQAKYMEDFTDDYEGNARFFMYYPYYQHMGYEQLRTYFTWRTAVRRGDIRPTSFSYVFLYVYELLSGIGADDSADGLGKLIAIWNAFRNTGPELNNYLPRWLKDYHVYYELPHSFAEFVKEHELWKYYSLTLVFDADPKNRFELWNGISSYNVTGSRFYKEGNDKLLRDCFDAVLGRIREFCESCNTGLEDLLIYSVSRRTPWQPFKQALFHNWRRQADRQIIISRYERYYCKNNFWTANLPIYYSSQREFVGYLIKKTESCLRQAVKYKYKLAAGQKAGDKPFRELQNLASKRAELDTVIEKAVTDFYRDSTKTIVTVDHANLARIREEALGTQGKLIVPEDSGFNQEFGINASEPYSHAGGSAYSLFEDELTSEPGDDDRNGPVERNAGAETTGQKYADFETSGNAWTALQKALSATELKALSIALRGDQGIKAFADESGIMLEVLADNINEKAADYIGDNILEMDDDITIFDEYRENILRLTINS